MKLAILYYTIILDFIFVFLDNQDLNILYLLSTSLLKKL